VLLAVVDDPPGKLIRAYIKAGVVAPEIFPKLAQDDPPESPLQEWLLFCVQKKNIIEKKTWEDFLWS
jgi:hypothetical protein